MEGLYYPYSENKGTDQLRGYCEADPAKLICVFVFAYAKSRFSYDAAQMKMKNSKIENGNKITCLQSPTNITA